MYKTGDKPGKGKYRCMQCGEIVTLDDQNDTLPTCPLCHATDWTKV
jgi:DNA-directed RNA polymerase subunit RPC12/RpoP